VISSRSKRHRAQAGTTLIELLVSTLIIGLAVVLLVGLFSTGVIDSKLASRDVAAQTATEYELEKIGSMQYSASPTSYSECFTSDGSSSPSVVPFQGGCPASARIRANVSPSVVQGALQQWTVTINSWPDASQIGKPVSTYKVNR
jgi:Tfp pilus assembly protein PilV